MILTIRYPHIRELVSHYAKEMDDTVVSKILLDDCIKNEGDARHLSEFIWKMIDQMAADRRASKMVLGGIDNTTMLPDLSYEMDGLMGDAGFSAIWEEVSDKA